MCGFQETLPTKEPQAFEDIKMNEVMLSVGIYHPRKVSTIKISTLFFQTCIQ